MQCYEHPEVGAVVQCSECNKGMCKVCAEGTNGTLCPQCFKQQVYMERIEIEKLLSEIPWRQKKALIALVWAIVFILFGTYTLIMGLPYFGGIVKAMAFFAIGGLPTVFPYLISGQQSVAQDIKDLRNYAKYGSSYTVSATVTKLIIGFIISAIAAPFALYIAVIKLKRIPAEKQELEELLLLYPK